MQKLKARCAVYRVRGRIRCGFADAFGVGRATEVDREPSGDRRGAGAPRPGGRRAAGRVLAGQLRGPRRSGVAGGAGGRRAGRLEPESLPPRPRPACPGCVGTRTGEHRRFAVRRGGAVVGGGDQCRAVRGRPVRHTQARSRAPAPRGDRRARGLGRRRVWGLERGGLRCGGRRGPDLPPSAAGAAGVRRVGAGERRGRAREHECLAGPGVGGHSSVSRGRAVATVAPGASVVGAEDAEQRADLGDRGSRAARSGKRPVRTGISVRKGGQDRTVPGENCPIWSGVSPPKGGQDRTLLELPAPENPAADARAGREPQNPRIEDPPNGSAGC